jgi:carbonic anhydrase
VPRLSGPLAGSARARPAYGGVGSPLAALGAAKAGIWDNAHMAQADTYLANNRSYAQSHRGTASRVPAGGVVIVACMDARMDLGRILGLRDGEANVLRNAGGVITDDVIRSLAISQRLLGTTEILLIQHTDCGMQGITDAGFAAQLESETGVRPQWRAGAFTDAHASVRSSIERIKASPFVPHTDAVRGFVLDVVTGELTEVTLANQAPACRRDSARPGTARTARPVPRRSASTRRPRPASSRGRR